MSGVAKPLSGSAATVGQSPSVPPALYWAWGLLLLVPVWVPKYLPTEDGLAHLYWVEIYRVLADPESVAAHFFVRNVHWDAPHQLLYFIFQYGLGAVLEPHLAQKVVVSFAILAWVGAIWFLSRVMSREVSLGAFAALLLVHSSWFYNGFFAFIGAIPILLVVLGVLARLADGSERPDTAAPYITIGVLGVLAHYAHFFVSALFVMLGVLWLAFPWRPLHFRKAYLALSLIPSGGLIAWYQARGTVGEGGMIWEPFVRVLARFFGLAFFRGFAGPTPSYWIALAAFASIVGFLIWHGVRSSPFASMPLSRRFVILFAGLIGVSYFFAPAAIGEAWPFHGRLQYAGLALFLPSLPSRPSPRARLILLTVVSLLLSWQIVTFSIRSIRFSRNYEAVLRQAEAIPSGATLLSSLQYERARYEGSFVRVLAAVPDDLAHRRKAVLLNSVFPAFPFYWVRPRFREIPPADLRIDLRTEPDGGMKLLITRP